MKKSFIYKFMIVVIATISMGFTSCSDDDDDNKGVDKNILIRKWVDGSESLEFKKNGDFTFVVLGQTLNGTYKITDSAHTDNYNGEKMTATWFMLDLTDSSGVLNLLAVYDHKEDSLLVYIVENGVRERINTFHFT